MPFSRFALICNLLEAAQVLNKIPPDAIPDTFNIDKREDAVYAAYCAIAGTSLLSLSTIPSNLANRCRTPPQITGLCYTESSGLVPARRRDVIAVSRRIHTVVALNGVPLRFRVGSWIATAYIDRPAWA